MALPPSRDAVANDLSESYQLILGTAQGAAKTITGATNASPIVVTSATHGYANGTLVTVQGVNGNTAANGVWFIAAVTTNTFQLANSIGNGAWSSGGTVMSGTGRVGYLFDTDHPKDAFIIGPQKKVGSQKETAYISAPNYLTMRDSELSRIYLNDFRGGGGQITVDVQDSKSKWRFLDSKNLDISQQGIVAPVQAMLSRYSGDTTAVRKPMLVVGSYLYVASFSKVGYSNAYDWSAPAFANCTTTGTIGNTITGLASDGQFVYGTVQAGGGAGINKWTIASTTASASPAWNTTSTTPRRLIYANRRIYAIDSTQFYEVAIASGTGTVNQTLPTGWVMEDLCALRGGAISAPILVLATLGTNGQQAAIWQWDGTNFNDYMTLPSGFIAHRMEQYLGVVYITGTIIAPNGSTNLNGVYAITNGSLSFLGYLAGVPQSNRVPAETGSGNPIHMDFFGTFAYFHTLNGTTSRNEVWRYDIINGGFSRYIQIQVPTSNNQQNEDIAIYNGGPWVSIGTNTVQNDRVYGSDITFVASGQITTSDLNVGQPWISNMWPRIEITHSVTNNAEAHTVEYSTDQGVTWTTATPEYQPSPTNHYYLIPPTLSAGAVQGPYIRGRVTLTSGSGQTTTIQMYSLAFVAMPMDPLGNTFEVFLACPEELKMPNGGPDKQGLSGQERIQQIENLYESQAIVDMIYMGTSTSRAKNPRTITVVVDEYQIIEGANVGLGPNKTIEGTVRVVLRQIV